MVLIAALRNSAAVRLMHRARSRTLFLVLLAVTSCCNDAVGSVDLTYDPIGELAWYGSPTDTLQLLAHAFTGRDNGFCPVTELYTSSTRPQLFTYLVADSSVATVDARGIVHALHFGTTTVQAIVAGVRSLSLTISISPPTDSVRISLDNTSPHVGDTLSFRVDARDGAGAPVAGAQALVYQAPADSALAPLGQSGAMIATPGIGRFLARRSGKSIVIAEVRHTTGASTTAVSGSIAVVIP